MKVDSTVNVEALRTLGTMLRFVRRVDQELRRTSAYDLGLTDLSVLVEINRGIESPSSIADNLRLDRPRITRVTDRLVIANLVERETDDFDRRRCRLALTPAGEECLRDSLHMVGEAVDDILEGLAADRREAVVEGLSLLRPVLESEVDIHSLSVGRVPGNAAPRTK